MNINTGEIIMLRDQLGTEELEKVFKSGLTPIPEELQSNAEEALGGRDQTTIDLGGNTPLANWARQERQHRKKSNKVKMAKASRSRNRRK